MLIPLVNEALSTSWLDAIPSWMAEHWKQGVEWLSEPHVYAVLIAWSITFTLVSTLIMTVGGFGPVGIVGGSLAAAFQSYMYGAFTPAGGIFATLTSMAMLGTLMLPVMVFASIVATGVAAILWGYGVGR